MGRGLSGFVPIYMFGARVLFAWGNVPMGESHRLPAPLLRLSLCPRGTCSMRPAASLGLLLVLAGCVPPVTNNMLRGTPAADTSIITPMPSAPTPSFLTQPAVGYGAAPPAVPSHGLGAEAPMPVPAASRMPTIAAQPGVPSAASAKPGAAGQSIMVPNGNGTTTIIHSDGTVETIPTPK